MPLSCYRPPEYEIPHEKTKNQGLVLDSVQQLRLATLDVPSPKADQVQIQIKTMGISSTDIQLWRTGHIGNMPLFAPQLLGCEGAGIITAVGSAVQQRFQVGDRVAIEAAIPCSQCNFCLDGRYNLCTQLCFRGMPPYDGIGAHYVTHPADWLHRLPERITFQEAAMLDPLSVAIAGIDRARIGFGESLLITGCNLLGLLTLMVAKATGISPVVVAGAPGEPLDMAIHLGADYTQVLDPKWSEQEIVQKIHASVDGGTHCAIDCSGEELALRVAIMTTRLGGTCCRVGIGQADQTVPVSAFALRDVTLRGVHRHHHTYPRAIELIASGRIDVNQLISHTYPLSQAAQAFQVATTPGATKVQLTN